MRRRPAEEQDSVPSGCLKWIDPNQHNEQGKAGRRADKPRVQRRFFAVSLKTVPQGTKPKGLLKGAQRPEL